MTDPVTKNNNKLDLGLNQRGSKKKRKKNVLEEDGDSSSHDDDGSANENQKGDGSSKSSSLRAKVNQEIAHEQAALRKRAQAAAAVAEAATSSHNDIYDYDGAYDSFQPEQNKKDNEDSRNKGTRYIGDLLKAAEHRKREREMVLERKIARELRSEEEHDADVRGKEKFITAAYKRKLQERELWRAEEAKKLQDEEANDVTKRIDAGVAMACFYGNLNNNIVGGSKETEPDHSNETDDPNNARKKLHPTEENVASLGFLDGFEKGDSEKDTDAKEQEDRFKENEKDATASKSASDAQSTKRQSQRELREEKVKQARIRYFQRHGISANGRDKISMSRNQ